MALDLSEEKRKVEAIESEIELEADRLQKDGMRSKEADAKARETILENHDQAIDDSIAILKGELASIGTGRDKELDHHEIEEDEKRKGRIEDILDEIERVTGKR